MVSSTPLSTSSSSKDAHQFTFHNLHSNSTPKTQNLLAVFRCLDERGLTLRDFLVETFKSDDEVVKRHVGMFYGKWGPTTIVKIWSQRLSTRDRTRFNHAALDVILKESLTELSALTKLPTLRHPADSISREKVDDFGLRDIINALDIHAPYLYRILGVLTNGSESFMATLGGMLIFNQSQKSNYFQMMMGLYLYSLGCPKRVISLLNDARLSVSHQTICVSLKALTRNALDSVRSAIKNQHWFLVYDNINFPSRKFHQRIDNTDDFNNGTTATIVIGDDLGNDDPIPDHQTSPMLQDFTLTEENRAFFRRITRFHLLDVLKRADDKYTWCAEAVPELEPLQVQETVTFPLPAMHIDQSTVEGNLKIIETIMKKYLDLPTDWFDGEKRIIIAGDQLTVSRVRSLHGLLKANRSRFNQMTWALPVFQLFHLQMTFCSTILQTHYGDASTPGSLAFNIALLGRKRLKQEMPCYYTADEFLRNTFEAMVRRVWEVELGTDRLDVYARDHEESALNDGIPAVAEAIREKYFVNSERLAAVFGKKTVNAVLFLRDMIVYMDLCAAIKSGDVKRIEEVLKIITIMFQTGKTKNYGIELLRLTYGFRYVWSPQRKSAIISSWLVNTSGLRNKRIPTDLYQEHNNLLTKTIYSAKGSNMSWDTLTGSISANIRMFSRIAAKIESQYDMPFNGSFHSVMSAERDMRLIGESLKEHGIFSNDPYPDESGIEPVTDMMVEGFRKLAQGRFQDFVEKMDHDDDEDAITEGLQREYEHAETYINQLFE